MDRVTILNVTCRIGLGDGKEAAGFGSMTLGNAWAFPAASSGRRPGHDENARRDEFRTLTAACDERGHPLDLYRVLEPAYLRAASAPAQLIGQPVPKLCTLVVASAFDAALHDAYGKAFD